MRPAGRATSQVIIARTSSAQQLQLGQPLAGQPQRPDRGELGQAHGGQRGQAGEHGEGGHRQGQHVQRGGDREGPLEHRQREGFHFGLVDDAVGRQIKALPAARLSGPARLQGPPEAR
jgi:hypothetical protein